MWIKIEKDKRRVEREQNKKVKRKIIKRIMKRNTIKRDEKLKLIFNSRGETRLKKKCKTRMSKSKRIKV